MKKLLLASTALFALSGITAAAAQVDIAGNVRFNYEAWSDGINDTQGANNNRMTSSTEINFSADTVSNSGLRIQPYARLTDGGVTKRYIQLSDDWGTLIVGAQSSPAGSLSLDADWRDTVSGASRPSGNIVTNRKKDGTALVGGELIANGDDPADSTSTVLAARNDVRIGTGSGIGLSSSSTPKIIYLAPTVNSLKIGVSLTDAGDGSGANITEYGLQYTLPERWGVTATLGYVAATRADSGKTRRLSNLSDSGQIKDKDGASNNELGVLVTYGDWQGSYVRVSRTTDLTTSRVIGTGSTASGYSVVHSKVEDSGTELEIIYNAADNLVLNAVIYNGKGSAVGPVKGDKFSSTGFGAKYTIAPGLHASLGWNSFDYKDGLDAANSSFKGSAYRLRLNADF